jgi:hypothetical protein
LVLALTLGEGLARRQAEAEARATQPPAPPPALPPTPAPAQAPPKVQPPRWQLWAGTAAGTDPLGGVGPAIAAGFALQPGLLRFGLRLEATFPRSTPLVGFRGEVRSTSFGAGLEACVAPAWGSVQLAACADGGLTALLASGEGTARDSEVSVPLYGAGPAISVEWLFHPRAFLRLGGASRFFFERPELVVQGLAESRHVELLTLSGELGAGVRW